jgi:hypothetical protein
VSNVRDSRVQRSGVACLVLGLCVLRFEVRFGGGGGIVRVAHSRVSLRHPEQA